jgi:fatty acid desaturase
MKTRFFAHSRLDGLMVAVAFIQFGFMILGVTTFGFVPWWVSLVLGLITSFLVVTNFQCIAHNFLHNPFFVSKTLNRAYSVFNSLLIGLPQTLYRVHHLHHHKYNNDACDLKTGTTKDRTSTWRYSKRLDQEENMLRYALLGVFRVGVPHLFRGAQKNKTLHMVVFELAALAAMATVFGMINPLGLIAFHLPVALAGTLAAQTSNYLEHYGAIPGNRKTDSVSSYGWFYNLIWFNNGYHQEHHYRPQVHWARVPEIKKLLPPEVERRVAPGAHLFNFGPRRHPVCSSRPAAKMSQERVGEIHSPTP